MSLHLHPCRILSNGCLGFRKIWRHSMKLRALAAAAAAPSLRDGVLEVNGRGALIGVPDNVVVSPMANGSAFLGAVSDEVKCRHVFNLGILR
ncbi:hypothetical protein QJS04_geneDACA007847 [Acorus gramineus]|uniref:Uncharacterized protein n=1 Tax=Acorus gramineus TaxID=55184 RepID=A0AAV9BC41_ACOGR|nr:hypothetical protein QJS04_geneDACA007847 [Acorus gramineus]